MIRRQFSLLWKCRAIFQIGLRRHLSFIHGWYRAAAWCLLWLLGALLFLGAPARAAQAQAAPEHDWSPPQNLSQSGAATDPLLFWDARGVPYVLWRDTLAGPMFTRGNAGTNGAYTWSPPVAVDFPFATARPILLSTPDNVIHAFWLTAEGALQVNQVAAGAFADSAAWSAPQTLAQRVLSLAATIGADDRLHLAYAARQAAPAAPASIFYRQSADDGATWSEPTVRYQSPYLRATAPALQIVAADDLVMLAWDVPPLERVYLSRSADGGASWDAPTLVDQRAPEDLSDAVGPARPVLANAGTTTHLLWPAEHGQDACRLRHQWTDDDGRTWQTGSVPLTGCPQTAQFLGGEEGLLLWAQMPAQLVLLAWNGQQWSDPQAQTGLADLINPATYRRLALACIQMGLDGAERLLLVGCDSGSQDTWATTRAPGDIADWFPPPPVWQPLTAAPSAGNTPSALAVDADGFIHRVWSQAGSIYYARWDGANWSQPVSVLTLPGSDTGPPAITMDARGRLLLTAAGGGSLTFSQAGAAAAAMRSNWSEPLTLPQPHAGGGDPTIAAQGDTLFVAYAIPYNEARGIYLLRSMDGGQSWSAPRTVFAAAAAAWEGVAQPRLALTRDGGLHLLWTRVSLPALSSATPTALYYARSDDGGDTFSPPEQVSDAPPIWYALPVGGEEQVHRLWQTRDGEREAIYHQVSLDGFSWGEAHRVSSRSGLTAAAAAPGAVELLQWTDAGLLHWQWRGGQWLSAESLLLPQMSAAAFLGAALSPNGTLLALLDGGEMGVSFVTSRRVSLPVVLPPPRVPATATPPAPVAPVPTVPLPTPTIPFPKEENAGINLLPTANNNLIWRVIISVIPAGLFVLFVLFRGLRRRREP